MKTNKVLRTSLIVMVIVLLVLVSFIGIYVKDKAMMKNIVKEYQLGMNLGGSRQIELNVNTSTKTIKYDAEGKEIASTDTTTEAATTEEKKINEEDVLTTENYKQVRSILENRLKKMGLAEYEIRQNTEDGKLVINIPENDETDNIVAQLQYQGKFEITDNDTNEVLMTNSDIKSAKAGYGTTSSGTTSIFVSIQFNEEGTEKYKEITKTYVETKTTNESGEETTNTKKIALKLDDTTLLTTYFDQEIDNGLLQLTVGSSSSTTTTEELQESLQRANSLAALLDCGKVPVVYEVAQNRYVESEITTQNIQIFICLIIVAVTASMIYLVIKYQKEGILCAISLVGFIATLLLIIRCFNVVMTVEGIIAMIVSVVLFYVTLIEILRKSMKIQETDVAFKQAIKKSIIILIPIYLIALVFTFNSWLTISSFGMVMFWGITLNIIYNFVITRTLLIDAKN